ncbi:lethal(2) giant larvae protein-like [Phlebotomus argentipes]|uniref:lethal(2) giant larvae protein-like n=1 Tax=Phlebotomus argentipes TaxID=94469 RepID=UPI00289297F4|nr:lethal(2) giant larvae protein-like [Phlebotomus argentipes]
MLKFIRGKGQQVSVERQRLQKELFAYRKTVQHGFPHKPSALAYDERHRLMAIGTHSGSIKVFGRPGVEFYGQHAAAASPGAAGAQECAVQLLEWVPGTGRLLSLTTANQLVFWEPAGAMLVPLKTFSLDGKLKKVSSLCCSLDKDVVFIGTEGGNVYQFDLESFSIREPIIYHDVVLEQVPSTYKLNPGAIECLRQLPTDATKLLITYNRGLCVLWDLTSGAVVRSFVAPGHGQSVGIHVSSDGEHFTWYHADGSYARWRIADAGVPDNENYVPYGPDPCKSINRLVSGRRAGKDLVVFSGGMPRSAYGDHHCVSVHCADGAKVALDFTSKVVDFFVTFGDEQEAQVLIVLLEEELAAYDLTDPKVPVVKTPYMHSIHASAVTCNHLVSQVSAEVYEKIIIARQQQQQANSLIEWPVSGGRLQERFKESGEVTEYDILLTGHEDGSVRFWNCSDVILTPILNFKTAPLFGHGEPEAEHGQENSEPLDDSEPPFRKAGNFDPYSDDPRLAVKKVALCPKTGTLVVAGTAGHIVVASFDILQSEVPLKVTTMNLVSDRDGFVWKGHDQLNVRQQLLDDTYTTDEGIQVVSVLQVLPPAGITAVALESSWNLVAAGTGHGLVLFDYFNQRPVLHKCTLNPNDLSGAGETLSRKKSFKKTLRESFRRLRRGRSTRNNPAAAAAGQTTTSPILETRPIERQVEARPVDDGMGSMVRCLAFAQTYITNVHSTVPTLWSATNSSCVSVFVVHLPPKSDEELPPEQRKSVTGQLAKEIQLKHRAPVVGIAVVDHNGVPLDFPGAGMAPHRVLIASEEQFKVFSLPQLKPVTKYKLTAHEGARVRRMSFGLFSCPAPVDAASPARGAGRAQAEDQTDEKKRYTEVGLLCLTNLGDCLVLSVPELKRQLNAAAVRREDINGISSLCFTNHGEALYMMSSSEIQRVTLSSAKMICPEGVIDLEPYVGSEELDTTPVVVADEEEVKSDLNASLGASSDAHHAEGLTNGSLEGNNRANETISSSMGDITVDSVRDHLNSTTTTLCSTTTEEIVGRVSVLTTRTSDKVTSATIKDLDNLNSLNLKDLSPIGDTTESNTTSVVVKSVITSISHGGTNGEPETVTTTTSSTTRKESQF